MKEFNYLGLKCPIPVLKAFKELKKNPKVQSFQFKCDDPTAPKDFKDLCKNTGLNFHKVIKEDNYFIIFINRN
tara:strand:- start:897 stop:1115 length:219 start_codon:yes stop_codon:yes gene_type:complete